MTSTLSNHDKAVDSTRGKVRQCSEQAAASSKCRHASARTKRRNFDAVQK